MKMAAWAFALGTVVFTLSAHGDVPLVSNVRMSQDPASREVTIRYTLGGNPGIVTLDIQTNGVSIGPRNIQYVDGDVNREVSAGEHTMIWHPDKSWEGHKVDQANAKVLAWSKVSPPDYMTVGLAYPYEVRWYTCEEALPGGIENNAYRGDLLLMRKVHRPSLGRWVMGSVKTEYGRDHDREMPHEVTLTQDYWIGVFEVTQQQWQMVKGGRPSFCNGGEWAYRPVEQVSYNDIRGGNSQFFYPKAADPASFLGILCQNTKLPFDLPSEMQWEYACRAGKHTSLNSGKDITNRSDDAALNQVARNRYNGGQKRSGEKDPAGRDIWVIDQGSARVGSYLPNDWGLYDMHGNVLEWCLDRYAADITRLDGAVNTDSSLGNRVQRGGGWTSGAAFSRSALRSGVPPSTGKGSGMALGFRLCCPIFQ